MTRSQRAVRALDWIFERPIFSSVSFVEKAGIPKGTARKLLWLFQAEDLLGPVAAGTGRRPTICGFPLLLEVVEGPPQLFRYPSRGRRPRVDPRACRKAESALARSPVRRLPGAPG